MGAKETFIVCILLWINIQQYVDGGISFNTNGVYSYTPLFPMGISVQKKDHIAFAVQACGEAHIALMSEQSETLGNMYEIGIGAYGNTQCVIRYSKSGTEKARVYSTELNCTAFKVFWIKWSGTHLRIGRGLDVEKMEVLSCEQTHFDINYIGVTTWGGVHGTWMFDLVPPIMALISSIEVFENSTVVLPCTVDGFPHPSTTWKDDDLSEILPRNDKRITIYINGSLCIEGVNIKDSGVYTCYASNIAGEKSNNVTLEVKGLSTKTCLPVRNSIQNISIDDKHDLIRSNLYINKSTLSSRRRKLISVKDERLSATGIGYLGAFVICAVTLMLTIADIKQFIFYLFCKSQG